MAISRNRLISVNLLVLGALVIGSRSDAHFADPALRAATPSTGGPAPARLAAPAFDFSYHSRLAVRGQKLTARLSGRLSRSQPWQVGGRSFYTCQVGEPRVTLEAGATKKTEAAGIDEPFIVSSDGAPIELGFAESASAGARQLLAGLAGVLQFRRPDGAASAGWTVEERDASGAYVAKYVGLPGGWFEKRKLRYSGEAIPFTVESSAGKARASSSNELLELSLVEELRAASLSLDYTTRVVFGPSAQPGQLVAAAVGRFPDGYERLSLEQAGGLNGASVADAAPEQRFSEAYRELLRAGRGAFDAPTMVAVTTRLERNPAEIDEVVKELARRPDQASTLTSVLVSIDRPAARDAIKRLLTDGSQPRRVRIELLASLLLQGGVDPELLRIVKQLTTSSDAELAIAAINVEGELLRRAGERAAFDVTSARADYLARAERCAPVAACAAFLTGAGYVGDARALELLGNTLRTQPVELRLAALRSLESVRDRSVDAWIAGALRSDRDGRVRDRAIKACSYRGSPSCQKALLGALGAAQTSEQRITVLDALANGRFEKAGVRPVLARSAANDANATVRTFARKLLQRIDGTKLRDEDRTLAKR